MSVPARHARFHGAVLTVAVVIALLVPQIGEAQPRTIPELAAEATRLLHELAQLRGLPTTGPPPRIAVRSREERRRFIVRELGRKLSPARLEAERRGLVAWGLIPADFDLGGFLTDLVLEQAAAYYDPVGKVMVLANWLDREEQREALAHELVHVLQDRQIDLDRFLTPTPGKSDEGLARQALIEGEAVALTFDSSFRSHGQDLGKLPDVAPLQRAILTSTTGPLLGRAPRFLRTLLTFPYAHGLAFVHQFRRRHPWSELSRLYQDPPRSSTQILHPERYFDRREDPVPVSLPDLGAALGAGARRVVEDEAGEFGLTGILQEFLGDQATAAGWRGDRYVVWEDARGAPLLAALSVWESEAAATAFAEAYTRVVSRKYGLGAPGESTPSVTMWQTGVEAFMVEHRGHDVLLLERTPAPILGATRQAIWTGRPGVRRELSACEESPRWASRRATLPRRPASRPPCSTPSGGSAAAILPGGGSGGGRRGPLRLSSADSREAEQDHPGQHHPRPCAKSPALTGACRADPADPARRPAADSGCYTRSRSMPTAPSKKLERVPNPHPDRDYEVDHVVPEFTCLCPITGQPDFATIRIRYLPDQWLVELKSLKLYMWAYRDEGAFHEDVTNRILDDLVETLAPRRIEVVGDWNVRGGIKTVVTVRYERPGA